MSRRFLWFRKLKCCQISLLILPSAIASTWSTLPGNPLRGCVGSGVLDRNSKKTGSSGLVGRGSLSDMNSNLTHLERGKEKEEAIHICSHQTSLPTLIYHRVRDSISSFVPKRTLTFSVVHIAVYLLKRY